MALVDVIVVGQLAPDELPHQALGWAPTAVFLVAAIGLLQGVQVLAARSIGEKNPQGAGVALRRGLVLALIAGVLSARSMWLGGERALHVLRHRPRSRRAVDAGDDDPGALDPAAPALRRRHVLSRSDQEAGHLHSGDVGRERREPRSESAGGCRSTARIGSAWATVGARVFLAGALLALHLPAARRRRLRRAQGKGAQGPSYGALLAVGIAAAVSQAVEAGAFSAMTVIAGRISADVVAAYQIMLNLMAFVFMVALGLAAATAVLVSEAIGRQAPHDAARAGWTGIGLNAIGMIIARGRILFFAEPIGRAYTADVALAALIASLMWIAALVLLPDGTQVVAASALRARGDNWFPTFSHILAYAVVMPVLGYWLAEHQGMGVAGLLFAIFWSSVSAPACCCCAGGRSRDGPAPVASTKRRSRALAEGEVRDR